MPHAKDTKRHYFSPGKERSFFVLLRCVVIVEQETLKSSKDPTTTMYLPSKYTSSYRYVLVFQHLNSVVPSHTTIGGTASNQNDFGLSFLSKQHGASTIGTGSNSRGNTCTVEGESDSSSGSEREQHGGRRQDDLDIVTSDLHYLCDLSLTSREK
jgi:hypothetical protein